MRIKYYFDKNTRMMSFARAQCESRESAGVRLRVSYLQIDFGATVVRNE